MENQSDVFVMLIVKFLPFDYAVGFLGTPVIIEIIV